MEKSKGKYLVEKYQKKKIHGKNPKETRSKEKYSVATYLMKIKSMEKFKEKY